MAAVGGDARGGVRMRGCRGGVWWMRAARSRLDPSDTFFAVRLGYVCAGMPCALSLPCVCAQKLTAKTVCAVCLSFAVRFPFFIFFLLFVFSFN